MHLILYYDSRGQALCMLGVSSQTLSEQAMTVTFFSVGLFSECACVVRLLNNWFSGYFFIHVSN